MGGTGSVVKGCFNGSQRLEHGGLPGKTLGAHEAFHDQLSAHTLVGECCMETFRYTVGWPGQRITSDNSPPIISRCEIFQAMQATPREGGPAGITVSLRTALSEQR